jgi:dTDP-L-rhamnose 4-epimerase
MNRVLITGGAGFIGSHVADELLAYGHAVRVLDNLAPRVHQGGKRPTYLDPNVELVIGDVRDGAVVERALEGVDIVFHLAGAVGAGESVFEVDRCMSANNVGTAVLLDRLARSSVERLVLASSMVVYGEGLYRDASGNNVEVTRRRPDQLRRQEWEPTTDDGRVLSPVATPESKTAAVEGSVYAASKFDQERMCLRFGCAFGIPTTSLRLFNVFGARQSLANPYTGDLARFASRLLSGRHPLVAEDGGQLRDFVDVREVAMVCRLAMTANVRHQVINVGSGRATSLADMARRMASVAGVSRLGPEATGAYQIGDVRHCYADVSRAEQVFGHNTSADSDAGLIELLEWVARQTHVAPRRTLSCHAQLELELAS